MYLSERECGLRTSASSGEVSGIGENSAGITALLFASGQALGAEPLIKQRERRKKHVLEVLCYTCRNWLSCDWNARLQGWHCGNAEGGMTIHQGELSGGGNILRQ